MKNNRTFLEKLLDGAEVEWKMLDEIFHLKNGYTPSKGVKEYWENGSIPWFRMEDIRENGRILNAALQKVRLKAENFSPQIQLLLQPLQLLVSTL